MADSSKVQGEQMGKQAGESSAEAAQVGKQVGEAMSSKVGDEASQHGGNIREHMDVVGACGNKLGRVDHVEGDQIRLTRNDSPDGKHHLIPTTWVTRVDAHVHLNKDCAEAKKEWRDA